MEDIWMRWSLKLSVELETGETNTYEVAQVDREEAFIAPASLGLSITESKQILAAVQTQMVSDQVARHNEALKACRFCGRGRTKGYYGSVFKSVFGKVPMRLRRVWGCECRGAAHRTFSSIPTGKNPTAPELNYLTAKLAALMPFGKVADLLGELLPASAGTNAVTVRNRTMRVGRRLEKSAIAVPSIERREGEPEREVAVSLDGGYVRDRNRGPERNFEVVVGKVSSGDSAIRFAFVRKGTYSASQRVRKALYASGYTDGVKITMLSDGDAGYPALPKPPVTSMKLTKRKARRRLAKSLSDTGAPRYGGGLLNWQIW
jgi:hypothetical protein